MYNLGLRTTRFVRHLSPGQRPADCKEESSWCFTRHCCKRVSVRRARRSSLDDANVRPKSSTPATVR
eukprot:6325-Eustigmatos_ZCMA.PRE.1